MLFFLTNIIEGANIKRANGYSVTSQVKKDTMILENYTVNTLGKFLQNYVPSIQIGAKSANLNSYNLRLVLKNLDSPQEILKQLNNQGVEAKIIQSEFQVLEFTEIEPRPVNFFHTKPKQTTVKFGYNLGYGRGRHEFFEGDYESKKIMAFKLGFYSQIKLSNYLALKPEINYQTNGGKSNFANTRLHSIFTPLNLMLTTNQQSFFGIYIKGGGYYSYNFSGKVSGSNLNFNSIERNVFGSAYGFGFRMGHKTLDFSYNRGLSNTFKTGIDVKERSRYVTLGYIL